MPPNPTQLVNGAAIPTAALHGAVLVPCAVVVLRRVRRSQLSSWYKPPGCSPLRLSRRLLSAALACLNLAFFLLLVSSDAWGALPGSTSAAVLALCQSVAWAVGTALLVEIDRRGLRVGVLHRAWTLLELVVSSWIFLAMSSDEGMDAGQLFFGLLCTCAYGSESVMCYFATAEDRRTASTLDELAFLRNQVPSSELVAHERDLLRGMLGEQQGTDASAEDQVSGAALRRPNGDPRFAAGSASGNRRLSHDASDPNYQDQDRDQDQDQDPDSDSDLHASNDHRARFSALDASDVLELRVERDGVEDDGEGSERRLGLAAGRARQQRPRGPGRTETKRRDTRSACLAPF